MSSGKKGTCYSDEFKVEAADLVRDYAVGLFNTHLRVGLTRTADKVSPASVAWHSNQTIASALLDSTVAFGSWMDLGM